MLCLEITSDREDAIHHSLITYRLSVLAHVAEDLVEVVRFRYDADRD